MPCRRSGATTVAPISFSRACTDGGGGAAVSELFAGPFRRYMQTAGWVEGHNVRYDFVWADMSIERMPALASELVARNIDLVVTFGDPAIRAVQQATRRIPIVGMADDIHCHG